MAKLTDQERLENYKKKAKELEAKIKKEKIEKDLKFVKVFKEWASKNTITTTDSMGSQRRRTLLEWFYEDHPEMKA